MFGYVRPLVSQLKVGEYEIYRAVYCGLCRSMGKVTGQFSRLTLSYDFTFLALVRLALEKESPPVFLSHRCPAHPLRKRLMAEDCPPLRYTASAAAWLLEGKRADDLADEKGMARIKPLLLTPLSQSMQRGALRHMPQTKPLCDSTKSHLVRLSELEKAAVASADKAAQIFGDLLGDIFAHGLQRSEESIARAIGTGTGRFLYLCDAMDDMEEDIAVGRYNPFAALWGEYALVDKKPAPPLIDSFRTAALLDLEKVALAVELLPEGMLTEICRNIVYLGMPDTVQKIAAGEAVPKDKAQEVFT